MPKRNKKSYGIIFTIIIPVILLLFWFFASLFFNNKISFSVIQYSESARDIKSYPSGLLLKDKSIIGEFKANDNNLGIINLGFKNFIERGSGGEDVLLFRIKEKGQKDWKYINTYRSGSLDRQLEYPFGFPSIPDSKDKTYVFEIKSLYGTPNNSINLTDGKPTLSTAYQFSKGEILGSKKILVGFLYKKIETSFTNIDFLLRSLIFLAPLAVYVFVYFLSKLKNKSSRSLSIGMAIILIVLDILLLKEYYVGILIVLSILWIINIHKFKIESSVTFLTTGIMIMVWVILTMFGMLDYQGKLNVWIFTLFIVGAAQLIFEEKYSPKSEVNYKNFFKILIKENG
ncbi:MAG TPA: hypothetical protein VHE53_00270 [Patescibacteria group bacterium]|nr:hypothetical protein [Patescibacteria group bacterium]